MADERVAELSHPFEIDLRRLVIANHQFTMEGIENDLHNKRNVTYEDFAFDEAMTPEIVHSILAAWERGYQEFFIVARNQTMTALVTRFQHWAGAYARRLNNVRERGQPLKAELAFLSSNLGNGPFDTAFFLELEEVRNSIIHADAQPTWKYNGRNRTVNPRYVPNGHSVEVSERDINEAVDKCAAQIKFYDAKLVEISK